MKTLNQEQRLAKVKKGPGTFVYLGGACDTEAIPGIPAMGKDGHQLRSVVFMTVEDEDGKKVQVIDPKSSEKGELVWLKAPRFVRREIEPYKLRIPGVEGVYDADAKGYVAKKGPDGKDRPLFLELPKGKPVKVSHPNLAIKLRCLKFFEEVEADEKPVETKPAPKAKGEKSATSV